MWECDFGGLEALFINDVFFGGEIQPDGNVV